MTAAQKFWDKQAAKYDDGERRFEPVFDTVLARTRSLLHETDAVLDFGCATGTKTLALAPCVEKIHGLDFSKEMIHEATRRQREAGIDNAVFTRGTLFGCEFPEGHFDRIVSYGVLHLLEDSDAAIRRIRALLKPGGLFVATTACMKDPMALRSRLEFGFFLLVKRLRLVQLHVELMTVADVENLVERAGFELVEKEAIFHGITISYLVARKPEAAG